VTLDSVEATRGFVESYNKTWADLGRSVSTRPKFGLGRFVVVADTDEQAHRIGERAYPKWFENFYFLFQKYGRMPKHPRPAKFSEIIADGRAVAGSPKTVANMIRAQMTDTGCDYFVGQFAFGDLTQDETLRSIDLFAKNVMPALR
jgi:alkanesulfonate monooxygenase SsuD/methylene tetrahydromethanopterin reductase-like flavin-dependent oxidoreductase (luciferase family)